MSAYYNEHDPRKAEWLRELMREGVIAPGDVDERSIEDVVPTELMGYTQCHFFAGVGVWSYAARLAGWPDDRPMWTGSCPCQPFSAAGQREGFADERHLWPAFHHLVRFCRPDALFGEQVANGDGLAWLDLVQADLEGEAYTVRPTDLCAAGFGAPHIRQRLFFVANLNGKQEQSSDARRFQPQPSRSRVAVELEHTPGDGRTERGTESDGRSAASGCGLGELANTEDAVGGSARYAHDGGRRIAQARGPSGAGELENSHRRDREQHAGQGAGSGEAHGPRSYRQPSGPGSLVDFGRPGPTNGFWSDPDWLRCRDGLWRPVEGGTFPLAPSSPGRMGLLRGYGDAINAEVAAWFIASCM